MKTITLEEAYKILQNCSAIIVDDYALVYPSLYELEYDDEPFLYLNVEIEKQEFDYNFTASKNRQVDVMGSSIFLIDDNDEDVQLTILIPQILPTSH
jgi:hypothetical protein